MPRAGQRHYATLMPPPLYPLLMLRFISSSLISIHHSFALATPTIRRILHRFDADFIITLNIDIDILFLLVIDIINY
jgi:hypothetical protein